MHKIIVPLLAILVKSLLSGCEKTIQIKVDDDIDRLVIEGQITNTNQRQEIRLSRNVGFNTPNNYPKVSGAIVRVKDNLNNEYTFQESEKGVYTSEQFKGVTGRTYSLDIFVDNQSYKAHSQMQQEVLLDSIVVQKSKFGRKDDREIKVHFMDPKEQVNYYRFVTYINDKQTDEIIVTNDEFNNGNQVEFVISLNKDLKVQPQDHVTVEMYCIDKTLYRYWYGLQKSASSGITPNNPSTNITPTTLGYFSAHTATSKSTIVGE